MKTKTSPILAAVDETIEIGDRIIDQLDRPAGTMKIAGEFTRLRQEIGRLPFVPLDDCYLYNTLADAEGLCGRSEWKAARWQMQQVVRRLRRFRDEWRADTQPTVTEPESPQSESAQPGTTASVDGAWRSA